MTFYWRLKVRNWVYKYFFPRFAVSVVSSISVWPGTSQLQYENIVLGQEYSAVVSSISVWPGTLQLQYENISSPLCLHPPSHHLRCGGLWTSHFHPKPMSRWRDTLYSNYRRKSLNSNYLNLYLDIVEWRTLAWDTTISTTGFSLSEETILASRKIPANNIT